MPPLVLQIIQWITIAITYAPEVEKVYEKARKMFTTLFSGGLITVGQQAILMKWSDDHEAAVLAGQVPPELEVEPDPQ